MSLGQRVTTLESQSREINERLGSIEISVKNTQKDIQKLFLHSARHEQQIEALNQKVDRRFDQLQAEQVEFKQETHERFDKIENTLAIIVNHLQKQQAHNNPMGGTQDAPVISKRLCITTPTISSKMV